MKTYMIYFEHDNGNMKRFKGSESDWNEYMAKTGGVFIVVMKVEA